MRRFWALSVRDLPVLDLRDEATRVALGVTPDDLVGLWAVTQHVARRARALGAAGLVVPSAALPGAWNLVVFPRGLDRVTVDGWADLHPAMTPAITPGA